MPRFFRNAAQDDEGTPNPIADGVSWAIARGSSQSGNFIRGLIHLGMIEAAQALVGKQDPRLRRQRARELELFEPGRAQAFRLGGRIAGEAPAVV